MTLEITEFHAKFQSHSPVSGGIYIVTSKLTRQIIFYTFIAYGNLTISIITKSGEEIFSMAMTGEMGRSFSNHRLAGLEAIDKLNKKMMKKLKIDLDSVFDN